MTQVWGRRAMVTSMHPDATLAALEVLRAGGNAVDASVALAATMAVVSPNWSGLAGDSAWLIHSGRTGESFYLDGYCVVPASLSSERLRTHYALNGAGDAAGEEPPGRRNTGMAAALVPGTPAALYAAWRRFGRRPFGALLARAIDLAANGAPVNAYLAQMLRNGAEKLSAFESSRRIFFRPDGAVLGEGELLVQTDLAATLQRFAANPEAGCYGGSTADMLVDYAQRHGGTITHDDLRAYQARWRACLRGSYRGCEVIVTGPPTSGVHVLQALQILDFIPLARLGYHSAESLHALIETLKLVLSDRRETAGDPDATPFDLAALLDADRAATRARVVMDRITAAAEPSALSADSTTHFVVVDEEGNIVSGTQSIGESFGCGEVAEGTGLLMNDRSWWMALEGGVNVVAPGRRPNIGHAPTLVRRDGHPFLALGSPGGFGIVQFVIQVLTNVIDYGLDIQSAIAAPRFRIEDLAGALVCEARIAPQTRTALAARGHAIRVLADWSDRMGAVEAIAIDAARGVALGGYDPRRNSMAAGL